MSYYALVYRSAPTTGLSAQMLLDTLSRDVSEVRKKMETYRWYTDHNWPIVEISLLRATEE
jgi:hypothetical protein